MDALLPAIVDPPFDRLGYFPLDEFLPRRHRMELALKLDAVLASPAFAAWREGEPLDVGAWLAPRTPDGRTPLRVLYLAHLDDAQRLFFVTLLLHAVVAWSRRQPGTGALRALLYFDEVFGYLPPHPKDPPSKGPLLTLLKQARSVGLGVVLATQNPVDLDYKALSNAGTWLVGRLQTRQDRARVVQGLQAATGGAEDDDVEETLARLPARTFVVREAGGPTRVIRSRQTLAFLRGPLTRREVALLGDGGGFAAARPLSRWLDTPPPLPPGVVGWWLDPAHVPAAAGPPPADVPPGRTPHAPALLATVRLRFAEDGWTSERVVHRCAWPLIDPRSPARPVAWPDGALIGGPAVPAVYERLPAWCDTAEELSAWLGGVLEEVLSTEAAVRLRQPRLGLVQHGAEDRVAFEARVALAGGAAAVAGVQGTAVPLRRDGLALLGVAVVWVPGAATSGTGSAADR
jgi:hypothetical protein